MNPATVPCLTRFCAYYRRLEGEKAQVLHADFFDPLPPETVPFDAVVLSANTLFCTPRHAELLAACHRALVPGGALFLDVYNALPWHVDAQSEAQAQTKTAANTPSATGNGDDLLVQVQDEAGRMWSVFEREPAVDHSLQQIACRYDFALEGGSAEEGPAMPSRFTETLTHHYALPAQLLEMLHTQGFEVRSTPVMPSIQPCCVALRYPTHAAGRWMLSWAISVVIPSALTKASTW
jgi:SAM-dependent methyltransferase